MRRRLLSLSFILLLTAAGLIAVLATGSSPELGLDLQGGVSVVLEPTTEPAEGTLDQGVEIIRDRVDALGVVEPEITRQGDAIVVQIPGIEDRERVLELVGTTAQLRFRPVLSIVPATEMEGDDGAAGDGAGGNGPAESPGAGEAEGEGTRGDGNDEGALRLAPGESAAGSQQPESQGDTEPPAGEQPVEPGGEAGEPADSGQPPATEPVPTELTPPEEDEADATVVLEDKDGEFVYTLGPTPRFAQGDDGQLVPSEEGEFVATGRIVQDAQASLTEVGQWYVALSFRSGVDGEEVFGATAQQCFPPTEICPTGQLAIVLDSLVQSAPTIQTAQFDQGASITGDFSEGEAKDLALVLRYGALPVELERQTVQTVSATLGEDSLRAGVIAGLIGVGLVALYMMLYYRALGAVAIVGLGIWAGLLYTVISWLGATQGLALTLAGVTGIIISVGVAVDSYVVYFERLKEEVKLGRTLRSSAERAFKRAFRTILAANIATFIGAAVLWWLTVGPVRGFAFFLGLSTVLGVVVTWFYTRPAVILLSRSRRVSEAPVVGVASGLAAPPSASPLVGGGR